MNETDKAYNNYWKQQKYTISTITIWLSIDIRSILLALEVFDSIVIIIIIVRPIDKQYNSIVRPQSQPGNLAFS